MGKICGWFSGKQEKENGAGTSISRFFLGVAILFLVGAIWRAGVLGLIFGLLMSTMLFAVPLCSPPLVSETDIGPEARPR